MSFNSSIRSATPEKIAEEMPEFYEEVKHCLNIVNMHNKETGFAYVKNDNNSGFAVYEQVFSRDTGIVTAVTPQEFRNELKGFVNGIDGGIIATSQEVDKQNVIVLDAEKKLKAAKDNLAELTGESGKPKRTRQALKSTVLKKLTPSIKAFTAVWKKQTTDTTGYQIQYSLKKNFKSASKKVTINKNTRTKIKIKGIKRKKKYYVRIRTINKTKSGTQYSSWSRIKTVKTK